MKRSGTEAVLKDAAIRPQDIFRNSLNISGVKPQEVPQPAKCPYCYRKMSQKALERHTPICREKANKYLKTKKPPKSGQTQRLNSNVMNKAI